MSKFMNPKLKFTQISRMERMSCIKELGTSLENRKMSLLRSEVERSLELIGRSGEHVVNTDILEYSFV